ncbi:MAG: hypothetical protein AAFN77_19530 [Planctomycetota bacterium]
MDFEKELEAAIERGQTRGSARNDAKRQAEQSKEDLRNLHNDFRLNLSEHIEKCLQQMADHFPGFEYETLYGHKGWGGAIARNDIDRGPDGRAGSFFSRLEITVKPQNEFNVVNICGKGAIRDKEIFSWNHFEDIAEAKQPDFQAMIDKWVLEYAEQFAARNKRK